MGHEVFDRFVTPTTSSYIANLPGSLQVLALPFNVNMDSPFVSGLKIAESKSSIYLEADWMGKVQLLLEFDENYQLIRATATDHRWTDAPQGFQMVCVFQNLSS